MNKKTLNKKDEKNDAGSSELVKQVKDISLEPNNRNNDELNKKSINFKGDSVVFSQESGDLNERTKKNTNFSKNTGAGGHMNDGKKGFNNQYSNINHKKQEQGKQYVKRDNYQNNTRNTQNYGKNNNNKEKTFVGNHRNDYEFKNTGDRKYLNVKNKEEGGNTDNKNTTASNNFIKRDFKRNFEGENPKQNNNFDRKERFNNERTQDNQIKTNNENIGDFKKNNSDTPGNSGGVVEKNRKDGLENIKKTESVYFNDSKVDFKTKKANFIEIVRKNKIFNQVFVNDLLEKLKKVELFLVCSSIEINICVKACFPINPLFYLVPIGASINLNGSLQVIIVVAKKQSVAGIQKALKMLCPGLSTAVAIGGSNLDKNIEDIESGVSLLIATPGRLSDLYVRKCIPPIKLLVVEDADIVFHEDCEPSFLSIQRAYTWFYAIRIPENLRVVISTVLAHYSFFNLTQNWPLYHYFVISSNRYKLICLRKILSRIELPLVLIYCKTFKAVEALSAALGESAMPFNPGQNMEINEKTKYIVTNEINMLFGELGEIGVVINFDAPSCVEHYFARFFRMGRIEAAVSIFEEDELELKSEIEKNLEKPMESISEDFSL